MAAKILVFLTLYSAVTASYFGQYSGLNVLTFGDFFCANSDVRGRLAVGGRTSLKNYNIACNANLAVNPTLNDQCDPFGSWTCATLRSQGIADGSINSYGLISQGDLSFSQGELYGSLAWSTGTSTATMISDCVRNTANPIDFTGAKTYFQGLSANLAGMTPTGTVVNSYGQLSFQGTGASVEVFFLDGNTLSTANQLKELTNINADAIIININGTSVNFQNMGTLAFKPYSQNVIFNFYEATSLTISGVAVFGSIIAPAANVVNPQGVFWGQLILNSFTAGTFENPQFCAQINFVPFNSPAPPTPPTCGDGVIQSGEDCDLGSNNGSPSTCCSSTCHFVAAQTTCRAAAGECDVAEVCTGNSAMCPTDVFLPITTPCSQLFGICDVKLKYHCPGNGPFCLHNAPAPLFQWDAFNVISFDTYTVNGGDIEGALAVRNNVNVSGFDIGLLISNTDAYTLFSLVTAGDATWSSGQVHPTTGTVFTYYDAVHHQNVGLPVGYIGVGGTFTAPPYLQSSLLPNVYLTGAQFDSAQAYYTQIQGLLSALGTNAVSSVIYGDGLQITCNELTDLYHFTVSGDILSSTNWYMTVNCRFNASWIIDVTGSGDVTIKGQPFSGIVERVIYNIGGTGRIISGQTGVGGNILAPHNVYTQSTGVTYGRVIVGDVLEARQNNKPNCIDFQQVTLTNVNLKAVNLGDDFIYVASIANYVVGDLVCVGGSCKKVLSGFVGDLNGDGVSDNVIFVDSVFTNSVASGSFLTTSVNPSADRSNPIPISTTPMAGTTNYPSSASVLAAASAIVMALVF